MTNNIFDDLCDSVLKLIKKRERNVKQDYKAAYRRLRNKLQKIYADYEDEDDGVKISIDKFKALDREAARIVAQMYKRNEETVQNTLESVLNTSYKSVNTITSKYNIEAVARKIDANNIIKKQVAGHIWTDRIKKYGADFVYDVHGIIHQGLDNGDTYTTTARKLKERFGKDIGNTMRIARTESARVLEDSKYQAFNDLANNESVQVFKIWHTMGDEAVRDTHDAMEGVKVAYDEDFVLPSGAKCQYPKGTGVAAEDINCRCYIEYVTELVKDENTKKTTLNNIIKAENVGTNKQEKEYKILDDSGINKTQEQSNSVYELFNSHEQTALYEYTQGSYGDINRDLADGIDNYYEPYLNSAIDKFELKEDIIAYRGTNEKFYQDYKVGDIFNGKIFYSSSLNEEQAKIFAEDAAYYSDYQNKGVVLEIKVPKGAKFLYIGKNTNYKGNEWELLLSNKNNYKVESISEERIVLEVVGYEK